MKWEILAEHHVAINNKINELEALLLYLTSKQKIHLSHC